MLTNRQSPKFHALLFPGIISLIPVGLCLLTNTPVYTFITSLPGYLTLLVLAIGVLSKTNSFLSRILTASLLHKKEMVQCPLGETPFHRMRNNNNSNRSRYWLAENHVREQEQFGRQ